MLCSQSRYTSPPKRRWKPFSSWGWVLFFCVATNIGMVGAFSSSFSRLSTKTAYLGTTIKKNSGKIGVPDVKNFMEKYDHESEIAFRENPVATPLQGNGLINLVPLLVTISAYLTYEDVIHIFRFVIDKTADKNWVPVDGGAFKMGIIIPAINGIVVPAMSILFATLAATAITSLRDRLADLRLHFNMEILLLGDLLRIVNNVPDLSSSLLHIESYLKRIISESKPGVQFNLLKPDSEMNLLIDELRTLEGSQVDHAYDIAMQLQKQRVGRISTLQVTPPTLHWLMLTILAGGISFAFLIETNSNVLIFMNGVELKFLWAMLMGTFSTLALLCYDLNDPFQGNYSATSQADSLRAMQDSFDEQKMSK